MLLVRSCIRCFSNGNIPKKKKSDDFRLRVHTGNSGHNSKMLSEVWGPSFWHLIFDVAQVNTENVSEVSKFLEVLVHVLPCGCRNSYAQLLRLLNVIEQLNLYSVDKTQPTPGEMIFLLKNCVNRSMGKAELPFKIYEHRRVFNAPLGGSQSLLRILRLVEYDITNHNPEARSYYEPFAKLCTALTSHISGY